MAVLLQANQQCSASKILAPFNLALALAVARIHRFEEQVSDLYRFVKENYVRIWVGGCVCLGKPGVRISSREKICTPRNAISIIYFFKS